MLVLLSNGNGSSPCIYHTEDSFYQQCPYKWGIIQSSWFNIYQGRGQKGDGNGTVLSNINTYSVNSVLELTQVLKIWVDSDLCQRNLEGI